MSTGQSKLFGPTTHKTFLLLVILLFFACTFCFSQTSLQTLKTAIIYDSPADLLEMKRRLAFIPEADFYRQYFIAWPASDSPLHPRLAAKVDGLLLKVSNLLRLKAANLPLLRIRLSKDGHAVRKSHVALMVDKKKPLFGYSPLEAFYEARSYTIYLSLADLSDGILAHEMAHFIMCTALAVRPPHDTQESWARHVETLIH